MYVRIMKILDLTNLETSDICGCLEFKIVARPMAALYFLGSMVGASTTNRRLWDEQLEVLVEEPSPLFIFACKIIYVKNIAICYKTYMRNTKRTKDKKNACIEIDGFCFT